MRVPPIGPTPTTAATRRTAAAGFSVPTEESGGAPSVRSASGVSSIDALLALQAEGFDPDRRGRQMKRAHASLDKLDAIKRALILGGLDQARAGLMALDGAFESTGDAGLDDVLLEIETRRAVELAKMERR
jgi:hypothetical protein